MPAKINCASFCTEVARRCARTKTLPDDMMATSLNRCLGSVSLTFLGLGHIVGITVYTLVGVVANKLAGPGVIISFIIAGLFSFLTSLCYAELASRYPKTGSAYLYTYISMGEMWAFFIGWNVILQNIVVVASIGRAFSGTLDSFVNYTIRDHILSVMYINKPPMDIAVYPDIFAFFICMISVLIVSFGAKVSTNLNNFLTTLNLGVIMAAIILGFAYGKIDTLKSQPLLPFGWKGVFEGVAACYFGFTGIDNIANASEEVKDPRKAIPISTYCTMSISSLLYVLSSVSLLMLVSYDVIYPAASFADAFSQNRVTWVKFVIGIGSSIGLGAALLTCLYSLPRIFYAMGNDGLLFPVCARVSKKMKVPVISIILSGLFGGITAIFIELNDLIQFVCLGTIVTYNFVCTGLLMMRYKQEKNDETLSFDEGLHPLATNGGALKPKCYFLKPILGPCLPIKTGGILFIYHLCSLVFNLSLKFIVEEILDLRFIFIMPLLISGIFLLSCITVIFCHQHNIGRSPYEMPLVPLLPLLNIFFNYALLVTFPMTSWLRFIFMQIIGVVIYFCYGIRNSKENTLSSEDITYLLRDKSKDTPWGGIESGQPNPRQSITISNT